MLTELNKLAVTGAFKDVLVTVVNTKEDEAALRVGDELCALAGGRLTALLAPPMPDMFSSADGYSSSAMWASVLAQLREDALREEGALTARLAKASSPVELRSTKAEYFLSRQSALMSARHADLAIFTRPNEKMDRHFRGELIEAALFQSGRPVLIVPPNYKKPIAFKHVVVGWNSSREAARAVGDAAAILAAADAVTVVTVDASPSTVGPGEAPGADIAAHLARRGVKVELRNVDGMGRSHGDCLLDVAHGVGADLIVLGGYGHARLSEMVFGGVTKAFLRDADVPLFMSH
jgi:nucleotide-binding universal stress UspA family protein